jgi:hypothetical protein
VRERGKEERESELADLILYTKRKQRKTKIDSKIKKIKFVHLFTEFTSSLIVPD